MAVEYIQLKKYTVRVPTAQYAYIEAEIEASDPLEAIQLHNNIQKEYERSIIEKSIDTKEWNGILDRYLQENRISSEDYESLSNNQKLLINEIKKSINRINK